mmetsp:Transcript_41917/g.96169  ORF Transcript_41917/g.96169 Transcript_41917/m.96169 type:complete len:326 (+) Transcript_41917:79-1056(+)
MAVSTSQAWSSAAFKQNFSINLLTLSDEHVRFEMMGIEPALANALRRILIAEVPTVAISEVTLLQNTSVIPDENLVHRLGLVPIFFDPGCLAARTYSFNEDDEDAQYRPDQKLTDPAYSVVFALQVKNPNKSSGLRKNVYSKDLVWQPQTDEQREAYGSSPPRPVADDILIAKLSPGEEIDCMCYCERGTGRSHIKWSPVCNATYRLLQSIRFERPVIGEDAVALRKACPEGVINIVKEKGTKRAAVGDLKLFTVDRQCLEPFRELGVTVESVPGHYLFNLESVGQVPAPELFARAIAIFKSKCQLAKEMVLEPDKFDKRKGGGS